MTSTLFTELQSSAVLPRLLEATIKGSIILVIAASGTSLLRNRSAALRHMVWVVASVAAVAVLFLPAVVPAWRVLPALSKPVETATVSNAPASATVFESMSSDGEKVIARESTRRPQRNKAVSNSSASPAFGAATVEPPLSPHNNTIPEESSSISWSAIALAAWISGIVFWLGYYFMGTLKVRRLMKTAEPVIESNWITLAESAREQLQIRRPVALLCSSETEVPLTFGVIYPKIVLPGDSEEWTAMRKNAVIRHEMAHIARLDALTQSISHLACAVYWFNPLVWIAAQRVKFERERACDDYVLAAGSAPSEYANDLLTMVSSFRKSEHYAVALAMARKTQLEGRLVALLNPKLSRQKISFATASSLPR